MPGYTSRLWSQDSQPQYWSKYQVWEWLQQMLDMHQIDTATIPFQNFDVDGRQLCSMTYQDFTRAAGTVGPILYHSLTELKWSGGFTHWAVMSSVIVMFIRMNARSGHALLKHTVID